MSINEATFSANERAFVRIRLMQFSLTLFSSLFISSGSFPFVEASEISLKSSSKLSLFSLLSRRLALSSYTLEDPGLGVHVLLGSRLGPVVLVPVWIPVEAVERPPISSPSSSSSVVIFREAGEAAEVATTGKAGAASLRLGPDTYLPPEILFNVFMASSPL